MTVPLYRLPDSELDRWLHEDAPYGDLTTHALGIGDMPARITFTPRQPGVVASTEEAARLLERCGAHVLRHVPSGTAVAAGTNLLTADGPAAALHLAWKPAQTVVEYAMAIATTTRAILDEARSVDPQAVVACTRKAVPGTRAMAMKAVLAGGGLPHRLGISDTVLVFAQHRALLGDDPIPALVALARRLPERAITIEVDTVDEARALLAPLAAAGALPGVVQLDKGGPAAVTRLGNLLTEVTDLADRDDAVGVARHRRPVLAAAGGITAANAASHVAAGAEVVVTSAPYHARPLDITVRITATG